MTNLKEPKEGMVGIEQPNSRRPNQTGVYRGHLTKDTHFQPNSEYPQTVFESFNSGWKQTPNKPLFGKRTVDPKSGELGPYTWETYATVHTRVTDLSSGLEWLRQSHGLAGEPTKWTVGIYAVNRPEWALADLAATFMARITVALYDTYGAQAITHVINHAEVPLVVVSAQRVVNLLKEAAHLPTLKVIVCMDDLGEGVAGTFSHTVREWARSLNLALYSLTEVEALGRSHPVPPMPPHPQDLYTICYTSGTTGLPKGVMGTHWNYTSAIPTCDLNMGLNRRFGLPMVYFSFLPLAHTFERLNFCSLYAVGGAIGFHSGPLPNLLTDMALVRPTVLAAVPRILHRIYDQITASVAAKGGLAAYLFRCGVDQKLQWYRANQGTTSRLWDTLLFNRVRAAFGGRLQVILTGSAPMSPHVLDFLRVVLCPNIFEGYGLTETAASGCMTVQGENKAGIVGPPTANCEVKLVDLPEMNYLTTDKPHPRGEICFKGPNVFVGYYKDPEQTAAAIDQDGWFHTGDVGSVDDQGNFKIIDRKKNLFKLSQGEYVAPDKIEGILGQSELVLQVLVHGDPFQAYPVALVVPDPEPFVKQARSIAQDSSLDLVTACDHPKVIKHVLQHLVDLSSRHNLNGFERVRAIKLIPNPFTIDNDQLTPTLKLKRPVITKLYQSALADLYAA